jgi:hypothetical protein
MSVAVAEVDLEFKRLSKDLQDVLNRPHLPSLRFEEEYHIIFSI